MRKDILLPGLALAGGVLGFGLRLAQWASVYDPETKLFRHGSPITLALLLLTGALALAFLLLVWDIKLPQDPARALRCPAPLYMTGKVAAAMLMLGAGLLGLMEGMRELSLWRMDPKGHLLTYPAAMLLCALLLFLAGPATLLLSRGAYRDELADNSSLTVLFPPMAALAWLFAIHLSHGTDPVLMDYGFSLAAAAFLLVAHYDVAALFHNHPHPRRAVFCALMGVSLGLISLADRLSPFYLAVTAAFLLSALPGVYALLRNSYGPAWPKRLMDSKSERADPNPGA